MALDLNWQAIYLILCILGFILPYSQLISFILENDFNFKVFVEQMFINHVSSLFTIDVLVSSVVFWIFLFKEGSRLKIKLLWIYILCNLTVGLSLALPLFLLVRQRRFNQDSSLTNN